MSPDEIIRICKEKYRKAKIMDPKFIDRDYRWILGVDILETLETHPSLLALPDGGYELFGLDVKIDNECENEIILFMEVK